MSLQSAPPFLQRQVGDTKGLTSPVARMPTEILTAIFAFVGLYKSRLRRTCDGREGAETRMGWVPLMLVCRRWRNVGISTPWLWRRIGVTKYRQALQYRLWRAMGCTIDVLLSTEAKVNRQATPLLLPFASSIRSIQNPSPLLLIEYEDLPSIKPLFAVPLPALECIKIEVARHVYFDDGGEYSPFNLGLSERLHPNVRQFIVTSHIAMPATQAFWGALRQLEVNFNAAENRNTNHFLRVLAGAPNLESLVLLSTVVSHRISSNDSSIPTITALDDAMASPYRLTKLRKIRLDGRLQFVAPILRSIDAPALSVFHLSVCLPDNVDAAQSAMLLFPPPLRHVLQKCEQLFVASRDKIDFRICSESWTSGNFMEGEHDSAPLFWRIAGRNWSVSPFVTALYALRDIFHAAPLKSLAFEKLPVAPDLADWKMLQGMFPDLRSMHIGGERPEITHSLLQGLTYLGLKGTWPSLSHLEVGFGFKTPRSSLVWHHILGSLLEAISVWYDRGLPLKEVSLEQMYICQERFMPHWWIFSAVDMRCDLVVLRSSDRKSTRLNSSHSGESRMPSSA